MAATIDLHSDTQYKKLLRKVTNGPSA